MTEQLRTSLQMACAFAQQFLAAADVELRGGSPDRRRECSAQLTAALESVSDESLCQTPGCGHNLFFHEGTTGGICLKGACNCLGFKEVA